MNSKNFDFRGDALEELLSGMEHNDLELLDPPDQIWQGIESAVGASGDAPTSVVPLDSRRRTLRRVFMGVAAAAVAAVVGVVAFVSLGDDDEVLATATLAYDPSSFDSLGATAAAGASLVSEDGRLTIALVAATLPSPGAGADLEVWLIQPDDQGNVADLVSLGVVSPTDPESLDVPPTHDPAVFFVVDISVEPRDGDAGHSGRSILRGELMDVS
ncbi:MAG: anti-sigma factor [bacterium]|nr:anti-sigma factor [bacterium]